MRYHSPVFGSSPLCTFFLSMWLTSGSMWVRQVVRTIPPPKQDRAEMSWGKKPTFIPLKKSKNNCFLTTSLLPPIAPCLLEATHLLKQSGATPQRRDTKPRRAIERALEDHRSILAHTLSAVSHKTLFSIFINCAFGRELYVVRGKKFGHPPM